MPWSVDLLDLDDGESAMDDFEQKTGRLSEPVEGGRSYLVSEGKTWKEAANLLAAELNLTVPYWRGKVGLHEPKD